MQPGHMSATITNNYNIHIDSICLTTVPVVDMERDLEEQREYYWSGKTKDVSWRKSQLKGLLRFLNEKQQDILDALYQDLGKHPAEAYGDEIGTVTKSVNYALNHLEKWMSKKKARLLELALLATPGLLPEPLGLVLVLSCWNFPFGLSLEPLIGAFSAGNIIVLKPSELAPRSSSLLANALPNYLDNKAFKVVEGGPAIAEQLLQQKWDKIFYTGNPRVGRLVMAAAAKHLTPITLELGGKCPAVIDSLSCSMEQKIAVERILGAKFICAGQACIAVDYILVEKKLCSLYVELLRAKIKKLFGESPRESGNIARIVNKHHFLRLKNLLEDQAVKDSIVYGGSIDEENLFIEPTILVDPPLDAPIMVEEIFGPLLPIITLKKIEDSVEFIRSKPKPLAIYAFTKNKSLKSRLLSETSSGSIIFNDALIQYLADTLPFGGIGESGIGNYHGKFSFDTFSHYKAVVRRSFLVDFWFRFPPWNDYKLQLYKSAYQYDYLGVVLTVLGLKKVHQKQQTVQ